MKRIIIAATIAWSLMFSPVYAATVAPLYQVFSGFFGGTEAQYQASLLANDIDTSWMMAGDTLRIDAVYGSSSFNNAGLGLGQGLGYTSAGNYVELVSPGEIVNNDYVALTNQTLTVSKDMVWTEMLYADGDVLQNWFSDQTLNPLGGKDHFMAFSITDQSLLDVFNSLYGTEYAAGKDSVWMIAFEAANLGKSPDYTDLVAVVSRPASLNPVPVPGAVWLLGSGVLGLLGLRKRHGMKG